MKITELSDEQLMAMLGQQPQARPAQGVPAPNLESLSDADLMRQLQAPEEEDFTDTGVGMTGANAEKLYDEPKTMLQRAADVGKGIVRGVRDPIDAGAQLLTRGLEAIAPAGSGMERFMRGERERVEGINQAAEQDYRQNWRGGEDPGLDVGRLVGNVAATAPIAYAMPGAAAPGLAARAASGAATGAASGALQPVNEPTDEFFAEKAQQAALGGAVGAAAPALIGAAARVVKPQPRPEVEALIKEGVEPTTGQRLGPAASRIEQGMTSIPFLGDLIKSSQLRGVESLNRTAINKTLEPIGKQLDKNTTMGYGAIREAGEKISAEYERLLPQLTAKVDEPFRAELGTVIRMAQELPEPQAKQFSTIVEQRLLNMFGPDGTMDGQTMKEVESKLGGLVRQYRRSENPDHRMLGNALRETQASLRGLVERSNPQHAGELQAINQAYAGLLTVEKAAGQAGSKEGVFSPAAYRGAVKATDPSLRHRAFSRGEAPNQDFAVAAEKVLGPTVPDSGTPFRLANIGLAGGGYYLDPMLPAAIGAGSALYTPVGQAMLNALISKRPELATPIARELRRLAPATSAALPPALISGANE